MEMYGKLVAARRAINHPKQRHLFRPFSASVRLVVEPSKQRLAWKDSLMDMPKNQAAFIPGLRKNLEVRDAPYHKPHSNEIVIRTAAVAINPGDWKQQERGDFIQNYPYVSGIDVAGIVEEVGANVTTFTPGDRIMANPSNLSLGERYATFQLFVLSPANVACKIPDSMSFEAAVVLPLAVNTAGYGLFKKGSIELPKPSVPPKPTDMWIMVYGGSTSNGSAAVQLAKAAGVHVLAVAGKKNHELCRELGAELTVDYKDSQWIADAVDQLRGKRVVGAYNSVGTDQTTQAISQVLKMAGADVPIMSTGFVPKDMKGGFTFGTDVTKDADLAAALWTDFLPKALIKGSFVPKPDHEVVGHSLGDIQQAMDMQKAGVSARKLVVRISQ